MTFPPPRTPPPEDDHAQRAAPSTRPRLEERRFPAEGRRQARMAEGCRRDPHDQATLVEEDQAIYRRRFTRHHPRPHCDRRSRATTAAACLPDPYRLGL